MADRSAAPPDPVEYARDTLVDPPEHVTDQATTTSYERTSDSALIRLADARLGDVVAGSYVLTAVRGRGSLSAIYEARHQRTGERVAVKLLHPPFRHSKVHEGRFVWEARIAATIRHPHTMRVIEAGRDLDHTLYQVLELLQGETIGELLARGPLLPEDAIKVGRELLAALDAVHLCGYVHRAVNPSNVFLNCTPGKVGVKLLDYGLARHQTSREELPWIGDDPTQLGDPTYVSPELCRGDQPVTVQSDIWSAGVLLFHALAGRPPFKDNRLYVLFKKIVEEPVPSLGTLRSDLPGHLVDAVDGALTRELDRRWRTAHQMAAVLAGSVPSDEIPL